MSTVYIYGLSNPRTSEIRYVGKTVDLSRRLKDHCKANKKTHLSAWIKSLARDGIKPELFVIEESDEVSWSDAEKFWINYFTYIGANLTNITEGGRGIIGYKPTEEHKRKIGAALRGRKHTDEMRLKNRLAHLGKIISPDHARKLHEERRRKETTQEHRNRLSQALQGNKRMLGKLHSEESKRKMSIAKKGVHFTALHRKHLSEAKKAYYKRFRKNKDA